MYKQKPPEAYFGAEPELGERTFLNFDDRQKVWEYLSRERGDGWQKLEYAEKEKIAEQFADDLVKEVVEMAGGIWRGLSVEKKRELFHASLIDRTNPTAQRQDAMTGGPKPAGFPSKQDWLQQNEGLLKNMSVVEKDAYYAAAAAKAAAKK